MDYIINKIIKEVLIFEKNIVSKIGSLEKIKINIFLVDDFNNEYLISIKENNIGHLLGFQYFSKFLNQKINKIDDLLNKFKFYKNNFKIIKSQLDKYNQKNISNKIKLKFNKLLNRVFAFYLIMNFLFSIDKKYINEKIYLYNNLNLKIDSTHLINFLFKKERLNISLMLKDITRENYKFTTFMPISIFLENKNSNFKKEKTLFFKNIHVSDI